MSVSDQVRRISARLQHLGLNPNCWHEARTLETPATATALRARTAARRLNETTSNSTPTLRQSDLREAVGDALKITCILVRQDAFALRQRELGVHFEKFRPCRASVVELAEMA